MTKDAEEAQPSLEKNGTELSSLAEALPGRIGY